LQLKFAVCTFIILWYNQTMLKKLKDKIWRLRYKHYLKSDKWQHKRFLVLQRDGFKCRRCGSKNQLNVHHLTYANVFNEPLCDLITLCRKCHKQEHHKK